MSKVTAHSYEFGLRFSELVIHEMDTRYSREKVMLAASCGDLGFGTVLTRDADGNYTALKEADGTLGDAKAVLIQSAPNADAPQEVTVLRGYAIINKNKLLFDSSVVKKDEAVQALHDLGFQRHVRDIRSADHAHGLRLQARPHHPDF